MGLGLGLELVSGSRSGSGLEGPPARADEALAEYPEVRCERYGCEALIGLVQLEVVLQVVADAGQRVQQRDAARLQLCGAAHARLL